MWQPNVPDNDLADDGSAPIPQMRNIAELAKSGRSSCKKCKTSIENKTLRIGKIFATDII